MYLLMNLYLGFHAVYSGFIERIFNIEICDNARLFKTDIVFILISNNIDSLVN